MNFYSNMILFLPLAFYYIKRQIKDKNIFSFDIIFLAFLILFIGILIIGKQFGKVSTYFIMKNYYALWLILIYMNFKSLMHIFEENRAKTYAILLFYCVLVVLNLIFIDVPVENEEFNYNESITSLVQIFGANKTIIFEHETDYNQDEIEILRYVKENISLEGDVTIEIFGYEEQLYWEYSLLRYVNYEDIMSEISLAQKKLTYKYSNVIGKIGNVNYIVYFTKSLYYRAVGNILFTENSEIIYQNESGGIVKYNIE